MRSRVARGQRRGGVRRGRVSGLELLERLQQPLVQTRAPPGRDRALHGLPSQLVPEGDAVLGVGQQVVLVRAAAGSSRSTPISGRTRSSSRSGEQAISWRISRSSELDLREPGQHRVPHRGRQRAVRLAAPPGDVEGVAAGELVDACRVQARALDGLGAPPSTDSGCSGSVRSPSRVAKSPEQLAGRVARPDLEVAVAEQDRERHRLDAAGQVAQHVRRAASAQCRSSITSTVGSGAELGESGLGRLASAGRPRPSTSAREPRQPQLAERPQRTWRAAAGRTARAARAVPRPHAPRPRWSRTSRRRSSPAIAKPAPCPLADLTQALTQDVELALALQQAHGRHRQCQPSRWSCSRR